MLANDKNYNSEFEDKFFKLFRLLKGNMMCSYATQVSISQLHVLMFLKKNHKVQMRDIAEQFRIEKPTATSILNKLVNMKLVKRKADKTDRRVVQIILTEKGEEILNEAMEQRSVKVNTMLSYLSQKDKQSLLMILNKIVANIDKEYEK